MWPDALIKEEREIRRDIAVINSGSMSVTRVSRRRSLSALMLLRRDSFSFFWGKKASFWVTALILVTFQVKGQSAFSSNWSLMTLLVFWSSGQSFRWESPRGTFGKFSFQPQISRMYSSVDYLFFFPSTELTAAHMVSSLTHKIQMARCICCNDEIRLRVVNRAFGPHSQRSE